MLGVELVRDRQSKEPADSRDGRLAGTVQGARSAHRQGRVWAGNTLRIKPPMCLSQDDADFLVDCLDEVLTMISSPA